MNNFKKYEDLTKEEMITILGNGDLQAETTPVCAFTIASSVICADTITATISIVTCF